MLQANQRRFVAMSLIKKFCQMQLNIIHIEMVKSWKMQQGIGITHAHTHAHTQTHTFV